MRQLKLFRWAAALTLAIAVAPSTASAQEADTITISSTFSMDSLSGTVGPDLAEVYANGHEHAWTLTLHGTSQSHETFTTPFGVTSYATEIHATSFDLEFFGPEAATLNGIVSEHIAGGDFLIELVNAYSTGFGDDFALWSVDVGGPVVSFWTGLLSYASDTLFPSDANGYPVVGPDPFSIWPEGAVLRDGRPGNDGWIESWERLVTFEWSVGPLPGDFNGDSDVDGRDFLAWQRNPSIGDLADWQANYGTGASLSEASTAVPEPATMVLLILAEAGWCLRRRRAA